MSLGPKQTILSATTVAAATYTLGDPADATVGATSSLVRGTWNAIGLVLRACCTSDAGGGTVIPVLAGTFCHWGGAAATPAAAQLYPANGVALIGPAAGISLLTGITPATAAGLYLAFTGANGIVVPCICPNLYLGITVATATITGLIIEARCVYDGPPTIMNLESPNVPGVAVW